MHSNEKCRCCLSHLPALISGVIFAVIAIVHLARVIMDWPVMFNGHEVPIWASVVTLVIAAIMAIWDLKCACCCKKCHKGACETPPRAP